jgi:serine/threonine protein kinase
VSLEPGSRVSHYVIAARLGAGGMGEVFRARDERLGRDVAIKVLLAEATTHGDGLRRFLAEARNVAALNHPNVLTLHDYGEHEGRPFLVTELVDGRTLRQIIADGPLPLDGTLALAVQVAEGLSVAHRAGIVHRDMKPENVMVTPDGLVKVLDLGLAKLQPSSNRLARRGGLHHRSVKIPDLFIAACAEAAPAVVWHYDEDYDRIAKITGQAMEWIAPRGTLRG